MRVALQLYTLLSFSGEGEAEIVEFCWHSTEVAKSCQRPITVVEIREVNRLVWMVSFMSFISLPNLFTDVFGKYQWKLAIKPKRIPRAVDKLVVAFEK